MPAPSTRAALLAAACAAGLCACHAIYFDVLNRKAPPPAAVESRVFDAANGLSLDIYRPADARDAPVVVFIYGGSWENGTRANYRFVGAALAKNGVLAIVPDYRKAPAYKFPAFVDDAAEAVTWAFAHARELGGDPGNVTLMGHSSGAHVAALLAADGRYLARHHLRPRQLHGVIGLSGPYDFMPFPDPRLQEVFGSDPAVWPATQPVNFVDGDEPPFLLEQGLTDDVVQPGNSEKLAALLRARGEPVELRLVPHRGHGAIVNAFEDTDLAPTLEDTLRFVHARQAAAATATAKRAG